MQKFLELLEFKETISIFVHHFKKYLLIFLLLIFKHDNKNIILAKMFPLPRD